MSITEPVHALGAHESGPSRHAMLRPYLEDAAVRERRRIEAATALVHDYEDRAGEISDDELRAFQAEWLD